MERLQLLEGTNGVQQAKRRARKPSGVLSPYRLSFALAGRQRFSLANLSRTLPDGLALRPNGCPTRSPSHTAYLAGTPKLCGKNPGLAARGLVT